MIDSRNLGITLQRNFDIQYCLYHTEKVGHTYSDSYTRDGNPKRDPVVNLDDCPVV